MFSRCFRVARRLNQGAAATKHPAPVTPRPAEGGFTLLELLLVVALLLVFAAAAVISLVPLRQGAELHEGVGQLETLLRFARAEAAQEGRRVQVQLSAPAAAGNASSPASPVLVSWEPRPLVQPGVFVADASTAPLAQSVNHLVRIEDVHRVGGAASAQPTNAVVGATDSGSDPVDSTNGLDSTNAGTWPPIMFYPDGSSDSAEILVASSDTSDTRRMLVHWNGLSGSATHQEAASDAVTGTGTNAPAAAQPLEPAWVARSKMGQGGPCSSSRLR
jgi:prepilin-type N-terminal cleavage/methylation domain-containing protein